MAVCHQRAEAGRELMLVHEHRAVRPVERGAPAHLARVAVLEACRNALLSGRPSVLAWGWGAAGGVGRACVQAGVGFCFTAFSSQILDFVEMFFARSDACRYDGSAKER